MTSSLPGNHCWVIARPNATRTRRLIHVDRFGWAHVPPAFRDGAHIANRYFFIEEILQHFMSVVSVTTPGTRSSVSFGISWRRDPTAVAPPDDQTALRHAANEVVKMRCYHRAGLNHCVP